MATFDQATGSGSVLLDSGRRLTFTTDVFVASQHRLLRPGQRVRIDVDAEDNVAAVRIATMPDPT